MTVALYRIIVQTVKLNGVAGMCSVVAIIIIMTFDVVLRYIFNKPLRWSYDMTEYLMVSFTYLALAYTELNEGHVSIDVFISRLKIRSKAILNLLNRLLMLFLCVLFVQQVWVRLMDSLKWGRESFGAVAIPQAPFEAIVLIGIICMCVLLAAKIIGYLRQLLMNQ